MLAALYILLIIHLSLYPYLGWRHIGIGPLEFLDGPWIPVHQSILWRDITINVLGYIPLGFLLLMGLSELPARAERLLAPLIGILLSFGLEALQTYLPVRVPSKVDLLSNSIGIVIGTLAGIWMTHYTSLVNKLHMLLKNWLIDRAWLGVGVLCLWCFSLITPSTPPFVSSFWLGNAYLAISGNQLGTPLGLPQDWIYAIEQWGPNLTTYGFLSVAWLIGLAQTRENSPRFKLLIALALATLLTPMLSSFVTSPINQWADDAMGVLSTAWVPFLLSMATASVLIIGRAKPAVCGWLAIGLLMACMLIMLALPGVYDSEMSASNQPSSVWQSIQSASRWVSELWGFLALGVLFILVRAKSVFRR